MTVSSQPPASSLLVDILYEDDHLLALNKPAGVVVHPTYKNATDTILDALQWRARAWPPRQRPSIVGRLDKNTSGLLIVAKTADAHAALQQTLTSADSEKSYLAIVYGRVDVSCGEIDLRLRFDPSDRRRVLASADEGLPSVTRFERLACADAGVSLLRCSLVTGRRHQIRVHLAARGWPIVGDTVYGDPRSSAIADRSLAEALRTFPRQALHARRATFTHPVTGERLTLDAPAPRDFVNLLTRCALYSATV
ncbi:MAG: RluA family pseudouridine synthase [Acidobacteria bacterium]|nr:RluA family pseudouridine synthase [Acidobacteriota bacterium]